MNGGSRTTCLGKLGREREGQRSRGLRSTCQSLGTPERKNKSHQKKKTGKQYPETNLHILKVSSYVPKSVYDYAVN